MLIYSILVITKAIFRVFLNLLYYKYWHIKFINLRKQIKVN